VQGYLWQNLAPWERSITASMPFWHIRSITGLGIISGLMLQVYNMWMTSLARASSQAPAAVPEGAAAAAG
jgi:cbb3-type cytochrome oxidase subunit 1